MLNFEKNSKSIYVDFDFILTRVGMWEGISRPGPGRDGIDGKKREILISGDIQMERPKSVENPTEY